MRRRLAILCAAACALAVGAAVAHAADRELWPGVTYRQVVEATPNGPVVLNVITGPRPGGTTTLEPLLSNDTLGGRETLTALEQRHSATATYAGINGDLFNTASGLPSGGLIQQGQVLSLPSNSRSTAGVLADGTLDVRRVIATGQWSGGGVAHPFFLNRAPAANETALFTSAWGATTPAFTGNRAAVVLFPFLSSTPGVDALATVQAVVPGAGAVAIPPGGAVILARGTAAAAALQQEAPVGATVRTRVDLNPVWPGVVSAIGGGPQIVRDGGVVFRANEVFTTSQLGQRTARSAVGQLADGRIVLVAVDRGDGWSAGMTNYELGQALVRLGAKTAMALDGGGSTTMAFDGQLLNRPLDGAQRKISTALTFAYTGIFVAAPPAAVSPNGDGVDDTASLAYKVVRPASLTVTLTAPDGTTPVTQTLDQQPGTYPVPFPPVAGAPVPEGTWKLGVTGTDDLGQQTAMTSSFTVDDTLGFLQTSAPRLFLPPGGRDLTISWKLTREARTVVTVETKTGEVVRTLALRRYPAGDASVVWNGLDRRRKRVKGGVYLAHVVVKTPFGTVSLARKFTVRQIAGPPKR